AASANPRVACGSTRDVSLAAIAATYPLPRDPTIQPGRRRGAWPAGDATLLAMSQHAPRPRVELLTRDGCSICARVHARLVELAGELGFDLSTTDVDAMASAGDPALRAEFGDRLPVILLDGREHSYWEIDEPRLRADLAR